MTKLTAHYDGKFIVPNEPVNLPRDRTLVIHVEDSSPQTGDKFGTLEYVHANLLGYISDTDAEEIQNAINDVFEKVNPDSGGLFPTMMPGSPPWLRSME